MYHKTTLDNGLRIITASMPHCLSIAAGIFLGVGSRYETQSEAGISHFIEHLLFKGTEKRPTAREISEAIESVGGIINGGTDRDLTVYWCKVARPHLPIALDVLTDMLLHPRFAPADIEKERQIIIEEINMSLDSPQMRVHALIDEILWPDHPLGRDVAGNKESVTSITKGMMLDYMAGQYQPSNAAVVLAGDIEPQEIVAAVRQALNGWTSRQPQPDYLAYTERAGQQVLIEKRDIEQAHLCLAFPGLSLFHPQRFALDLLNVILGEGMSSRLFAEIRDHLGLAYSIHSFVDHLRDTGSVVVYAGVEPRNMATVITAVLEQLSQLKQEIPESELIKAKEFSKGRLLLRMEDSRNVAGWMGGQEVLTGRILSREQVVSIIEAVTAEELKRLAGELMIGDRLRLAVVGPVAADEPLADLLKL